MLGSDVAMVFSKCYTCARRGLSSNTNKRHVLEFLMFKKVYLDPQTWPKSFIPEALFRISQNELEKRLGFSFVQFIEEGQAATGFCAETTSGNIFAIIFILNQDLSPSLYLPAADLNNTNTLTQVLNAIKVTRDEIVHGYESGFTIQDLQQGVHLL
jgi:hypothetical protein